MVLAKFETTLIDVSRPQHSPGARLVVFRQDLLLDGFDVAPARDVEQAVPGRDGGAGLFFGETTHGFFLMVDARLGPPRAIRRREVRDHTAITSNM